MVSSIEKPKRGRKSKVEVQEEFEAIEKEVAKNREESNPKNEDAIREMNREIREAVKSVAVEGVVRKLSELGLEVSKALSDISEKLIAEVQLLSQLREAVALESKELERIHKVDASLTALDLLVEKYHNEQSVLEEKIKRTKADFAEEQKSMSLVHKEEEAHYKKTREREVEEYEYKKALERKKAEDSYFEEVRRREKQSLEKQENLEKQWSLREANLKEKEEGVLLLEKAAAEFPIKLQKEIDLATANAIKRTEEKLSQEMVLLKQKNASDKQLSDLKIQTLEDMVTSYRAEIESLRKQNDEAKNQVQDIAIKAIEGASGAKALNHVNQIAIEQAKTRPGN